MSLSKSASGRGDTHTRAMFITWNVNHGTIEECEDVRSHIADHNNTIFTEYAIEAKADGVGKKYHLHCLVLLHNPMIKESFRKNVQRYGAKVALKRDKNLKINAKSTDASYAYNRDCIEGYCLKHHSKSKDECAVYKTDEWKEEYETCFPSEEQQEGYQRYEAHADKKLETFAIDFDQWKLNQHIYDEFQDDKVNLDEVIMEYLQCCVDDRRMTMPTTRRAMVDLRQMLCVYLCKAEGCRNKYKKWWCTSAELDNTPKAVRAKNEIKNRETDEFIKQYLDSD